MPLLNLYLSWGKVMIFEITLSLPNAVWLRNLFVEAAEEQRSRGAGEMDRVAIKNHKDLRVYQMAFDAAMKIFEVSKKFPVEERYSKTFPNSSVVTFSVC